VISSPLCGCLAGLVGMRTIPRPAVHAGVVMAFQLKAKESLAREITRNVRRQIERPSAIWVRKGEPHSGHYSEEAVLNEVRKCFKKCVAVIRLVRKELGEDVYREAK